MANETDTSIVGPDAVLIALEYDATGLTASLGSTSALGNGLYSPVTDDVFISAIEDCLDTNPVDGLCTDSEYGPMPDWDVSQVTNMASFGGKGFNGQSLFNADISKWDVSSVTDMAALFGSAAAFNANISGWDTSSVVRFAYTFAGACAFDQDLSTWDISSAIVMQGMFQNCQTGTFNSDISNWNTAAVTNMNWMFNKNTIFDQDVSGWTGSAATSAQIGMFNGATAFQAKYECTDATTGPASSCDTIKSTWVAPSPPSPSPPPPSPPPLPSPPPSPFIDTDVDNSAAVSKEEFSVYAAARLEYVDAFIVIPDAFWNTFDVDSSGDLSSTEFMNVVAAFHSGSVVGTPWLVYPLVETSYLTNFTLSDLATTTGQSAIAAAPNPNTTMPVTTTSWQIWYENVTASFSNFSFASPSSSTDSTDFDVLATLGVDDEPEINPAIIPMVVRTDDAGRIVLSGDEVSSQVSGFDALFSASFPIAVNLKLIATEQLYDVVHVFNTEDEGYDTEQSETITKISHLSVAGVAIQDNTVVTVSGMVRFPDYRTSDVVCGYHVAVINAYKQQCGNDGSCTYEEADEYTADVLGYFEISVTPGDTYLFHASYGDHSICYSEDGFDAECSTTTITTMTLGPSEDTVTTNSYVVLEAIDGSESIVFYDTTERTVDVGLYAGACGTSYEGYTMLITPGEWVRWALSVADTDISGWTLTDTNTPNIKYWPYAAMDYYIQLDVAPSVSALTETVILSDSGNSAATCTAPGSNILTFFRDRDELVRTLGFLDTAYATATYQYHGYLCANPTIGSTETTLAVDWPLIDADETWSQRCYCNKPSNFQSHDWYVEFDCTVFDHHHGKIRVVASL